MLNDDWQEFGVATAPRPTKPPTAEQIEARKKQAAEQEQRRLARRDAIKAKITTATANEARAIELRAQVDSLDLQTAATNRLINEHEDAIGKAADAGDLLDAQAELATKLTRLRQHREAIMRSYLAVAKDSCASVYVGELHSLARPDLLAAKQFASDSLNSCEHRIAALCDLRGRLTPAQFSQRMNLLEAERTRCQAELRDAAEAVLAE